MIRTILLHAAMVGYGREPDFAQRAPGEKTLPDRVAYALRTVPVFTKAIEQERKDLEDRRKRKSRHSPRRSRL